MTPEHIKANLEQWVRDEAFHTIAGACGDLIRENERLVRLLSDLSYLRCAADYYTHGHLSYAGQLADAEGDLHERLYSGRLSSRGIHHCFNKA